MRDKLVWHQLVLFFVLALMTLVRFLSRGMELSAIWLWWWLGAIIGFLFVFFDRLVYAFFSSDDVGSVKVKDLLSQGKIASGLALALSERETKKNLVMRSALFLIIWVVLSIFTATSVSSGLARGFVLGIGTHLVFDLTWDTFVARQGIEHWFWQIRNVTAREMVWFVYGILIYYLFIIWFL